MNASINIYSNPKLLAHSAEPVLISLYNAENRHSLESLPICTVENIQVRADTVTSTLREILDYRPAERWGINE
jgi:hypothetical protein